MEDNEVPGTISLTLDTSNTKPTKRPDKRHDSQIRHSSLVSRRHLQQGVSTTSPRCSLYPVRCVPFESKLEALQH